MQVGLDEKTNKATCSVASKLSQWARLVMDGLLGGHNRLAQPVLQWPGAQVLVLLCLPTNLTEPVA
jgi:hypothetical protein